MKTLKITFALIAVLLLTVSGVNSDTVVVNEDQPTFKEYSPNDLVLQKRKVKIKTRA